MFEGLYIEVYIICILISLIILYRISTSMYKKYHQQLLSLDMILFTFFLASDALWALNDAGSIHLGIGPSYIVNILYFVLSGVTGFFWLLYCLNVENHRIAQNRTAIGLFSIPFIIVSVLAINSPFTHWVFWIDENNNYIRGTLNSIPMIVVCGYIASASFISFIAAFKKKNIMLKHLYISLGCFPVIPILAICLQFMLPDFPLIPVGLTLPLLLVYLKIADSQALADELTLLYNKNWFYLNHEELLNEAKSNNTETVDRFEQPQSKYLLMVDINGLALINSRFGYNIGNDTLKAVAKILSNQSVKNQDISYLQPIRFGSDEFFVICDVRSSATILSLVNSIKSDVSKYEFPDDPAYKLGVDIAYIPYDTKSSELQDLIEALDEKLFSVKKSR